MEESGTGENKSPLISGPEERSVVDSVLIFSASWKEKERVVWRAN